MSTLKSTCAEEWHIDSRGIPHSFLMSPDTIVEKSGWHPYIVDIVYVQQWWQLTLTILIYLWILVLLFHRVTPNSCWFHFLYFISLFCYIASSIQFHWTVQLLYSQQVSQQKQFKKLPYKKHFNNQNHFPALNRNWFSFFMYDKVSLTLYVWDLIF